MALRLSLFGDTKPIGPSDASSRHPVPGHTPPPSPPGPRVFLSSLPDLKAQPKFSSVVVLQAICLALKFLALIVSTILKRVGTVSVCDVLLVI